MRKGQFKDKGLSTLDIGIIYSIDYCPIGTIVKVTKRGAFFHKFIYCHCPQCDTKRWVFLRTSVMIHHTERLCSTCSNHNRRISTEEPKGTIEKPFENDIRTSNELISSYPCIQGESMSHRWIWRICKNCGKERWLPFNTNQLERYM